VVTVEGEVSAARTEGDTCILEFGPDANGFRVLLLMPVFSDLPAHPERLYQGRRIRATGRIERFHGVAEMVVRGTSRLEVVGFEATPPPVTPPTAPPAAAPTSPPAPAPAPPPVAVHPSPPRAAEPPPPVAPSVPTEQAPSRSPGEALARERCARAQTRWRDAAADAREHATALARCLEGSTYRCRPESAALAPALSALEWAEQQVEAACK
jgi:hypothetical protein